MTEQFITTALEAFVSSNGDIDKFELYLRRRLMATNVAATNITPNTQPSTIQSPNIDSDKVLSAIYNNDTLMQELQQLDLESLSEEQLMEYAKRMGLINSNG